MDLYTSLVGTAKQRNPAIRSAGQKGGARFSLADQLFVADWRYELLTAGAVFGTRVIGAALAGGDVTSSTILAAGGGAGTVIDSDQPELIVSCPTGQAIIPLAFSFAGQVDIDADAEVGQMVLFADLTQAWAGDGTSTAATPIPLTVGGSPVSTPAFAADAPVSACTVRHLFTADTTDPVYSFGLATKIVRAMDAGAAASEQTVDFSYDKDFLTPVAFRGPCMIVCCWGGTAAVNGTCSLTWAEVPLGRLVSQ